MDKGVNAIWTKRGNCILAEGGYFTWPKGSKSHGFSMYSYQAYVRKGQDIVKQCTSYRYYVMNKWELEMAKKDKKKFGHHYKKMIKAMLGIKKYTK